MEETKVFVGLGSDCPRCSRIFKQEPHKIGLLVHKKGTYGDFLACDNFPDCRYTQQIPSTPKKVPKLEKKDIPF